MVESKDERETDEEKLWLSTTDQTTKNDKNNKHAKRGSTARGTAQERAHCAFAERVFLATSTRSQG